MLSAEHESRGSVSPPGASDCSFVFVVPESEPLPDLLREDPRPPLLHGGPRSRRHEDLDGCHSDWRRGLHAVHELRERSETHLGRRSVREDMSEQPDT